MLAQHGDELQAGALNQPADDHRRARSDGRAAVGNDAGVGRRHGDIVVIDAEGFGGNLREDGVGALAKLGARHQHAHFAFGRDVDAGQRIQDSASPEPVNPEP